MLLNTSFNNFAEPIVETAEDALVCLLTTGLPVLFIDQWIVRKRPRVPDALLRLRLGLPAYATLHDAAAAPLERGWWRRVRSRLLPPRASGPVIGNTFNPRELPISDDVFRLLLRCDGYRRVDELLDGLGIQGADARLACAASLEALWERRLVSFKP